MPSCTTCVASSVCANCAMHVCVGQTAKKHITHMVASFQAASRPSVCARACTRWMTQSRVAPRANLAAETFVHR